jgi:hypothetical protein
MVAFLFCLVTCAMIYPLCIQRGICHGYTGFILGRGGFLAIPVWHRVYGRDLEQPYRTATPHQLCDASAHHMAAGHVCGLWPPFTRLIPSHYPCPLCSALDLFPCPFGVERDTEARYRGLAIDVPMHMGKCITSEGLGCRNQWLRCGCAVVTVFIKENQQLGSIATM